MRQAPELFDRRVKARSLAYIFTAGAALGVATLILPHDEGVRDAPLYALAAAAVGIAALVYMRADRIAEWQVHAVLASGTLILTVANYYVGPTSLYPIIYTWAALYAFYFFDLRGALAHVGLIALAYALLLVVQEPTSPVVRWVLAVGTPTVAGVLISRLLERLRDEAELAREQTRELEMSESRTRLILDSAPDAFVAVDADGSVIRWNEAAERLFDRPAPEAIGRPLRELIFPPEEQEDFDERQEQLLAKTGSVATAQFEGDLVRRDGTRFPAERTVSRVRIGHDVVMTAFIRDVSGRRRRQEEREALLREQAAREEAERMAQLVGDMQVLLDAALRHRRLDEMLGALAPLVREVLRADVATIFLADEDDPARLLARAVAGAPGRPDDDGPVVAGPGTLPALVAERRAPQLVKHPQPDELCSTFDGVDVVSAIAVPLMAEGRVTGVLEVASTGRQLTDEDLGFLRLAGERVALALDHARLYEREHRIAETLQRSLLPDRLPSLPGLAVAANYSPAAAEAEVGGDWYDVIAIPGGRVGLVMGDVAGKGLAAASMVGRLRSALRAYALEGHPPGVVVEQLNRLVWTELEESQMATLIYVIVDPGEGQATWVNAGHLPPLLVVGDRLSHFLEGKRAVPLGVLPFPAFEEVSVSLESGGTIVLYTDGLVERPGEHIDAGLTRLAEVVHAAPDEPQALCEHLVAQLVPEGGAADDVAVLALRNTPLAESFSMELDSDPQALASMRAMLRRWLRHVEGSDQEIAEILTACGEAATNAIEHAGATGGMPFAVRGRVEGGAVDISVHDAGAWREPRDGDHGRGLSLMRALMDDVEVLPSEGGTVVRLRRTLARERAEGGTRA